MLISDIPTRRVSQAPMKETTCHAGCGALVYFRTNPRIVCAACYPTRRAQQLRDIAERRRRKAGVPQVKGTVINCSSCAATVTLNRNASGKYCRACYLVQNGIEARTRSAKKAATAEGRAYNLAWQKQRRAMDPAWRVSAHMRVLMYRGLGRLKEGRSWRFFVPYTLVDLMTHLERQFLPGMTWENKGEWHIDHVVPLASFNFAGPEDPEFQAAWALANLRPLWGIDNIRKNSRRLYLL